jgi:type I restriction enzyme S subunit
MKNWKLFTFENAPLEIIDGDRGVNYPKQADFMPFGHCLFLNAGNVTENGFDFSNCSFISEENDKKLRKGKLSRQDIVLTTRGTVGNLAFYNGKVPYDHVRINSGMVIFRVDQGEIFPRYFYFLLKSNIFDEQVKAYATGSAQPQLPIRDIKRFEFLLPPLPEQRAIAGILGALDDKIELNRCMNRTLESMARAEFAEMMKDELGRMKVGTVGEDFNLTMGQSPPGETYNEKGEGIPFFQGCADFGFRYPENRVYCTSPTRFAKAGDTLVSVRAPVGDVNMAKEECAIGRGVAAVRHKTGSRSYTYYAMKSLEEDFRRFEAEGTVFGSINKADFQNLEIGIPTTEQVEQFEKICYPIDQMIENNEKEARTLASLRDSLLPKLMRGEVRVKEVEV